MDIRKQKFKKLFSLDIQAREALVYLAGKGAGKDDSDICSQAIQIYAEQKGWTPRISETDFSKDSDIRNDDQPENSDIRSEPYIQQVKRRISEDDSPEPAPISHMRKVEVEPTPAEWANPPQVRNLRVGSVEWAKAWLKLGRMPNDPDELLILNEMIERAHQERNTSRV
jgi:hypothetical protein